MAEMDKHYDPAAVEDKWYRRWMDEGCFHARPEDGGDSYCIVIPPPNVTGILHMGHALNNTIQDLLVRRERMKGKNALWVPGTDHAGIATQSVVERALDKEGTSREALGREAFLDRVWSWREQYGNTITSQLKKLGASCDWERERFTLDEGLSEAVTEVFVRLFDKGLIYRGNYIVNWCPKSLTALSDEEVEYKTVQGKLYYLRYPVKDGGKDEFIVVATTRPETMLGDTAVAVNPRDERYKPLHGRSVILPVIGRELPVIQDDFVDPEFGTGVVKVTPAHDPNDFEMGRRHGLESVNIMHGNAAMNENAGPYEGLDRYACRQQLMADLEARGLVEKVEDYEHSVGHNYRYTDVMIEPRLSPQWFVKMKPLAEPAIAAVKEGRIRFVPDRWTKVYLEWMENIRDWCISRQIWWGHRIPVFYCDACAHVWAEKGRPEQCPQCGAADIRQDEDVLDTWFSSWLWPFSVFGWPEGGRDLDFYYPTQTLVTASEIIFFWVARMIMAGMEFMGDIPFDTVYIHGTVRDDHGRKMSKSLGNSIDPLDIIKNYSADALRFSLIMLTATGQDVYVSDEKFEIGRNFGTKIWNAARYLRMQTGDRAIDIADTAFNPALFTPDDQYLLTRLHETIAQCDEHIERCRFNDYAKTLYEFLWHRYCDWYVEYSKHILYGDDEERREQVLRIMHVALSTALKLLHPVMPFLTEELWECMGYQTASERIIRAPWPEALDEDERERRGITRAAADYAEAKYDLIRTARTLMSDYNLQPKHQVEFVIRAADADLAAALENDMASLLSLTKAGRMAVRTEFEPERAMPTALSRMGAVYMSIEDVIDRKEERGKLLKQQEELNGHIERINRKLSNMDFVNKAPAEVVEREKNRREELLEKHAKLQKLIDTLS